MSNLIRDALVWQAQQFKAYCSDPVTYRRGNASVSILAMNGPRLLKIDDGQVVIRVEWTDSDFLFIPADLDFGAGPVLPRRGDLIDVSRDGVKATFEVRPFGSEPPWRESGAMIRVHTKQIDNGAYYS